MKTLVIAAHWDDESLSSGGMISRLTEAGNDVRVLTMFNRKYNYGAGDQYRQENMNACVRAIRECLKAEVWMWGDKEEGEPQKTGYYDMLYLIEKAMAEFQPECVIVPSETDLNQDHRFLAEVCKIALRPSNLGGIIQVLAAHALDGGTPATANWFVELKWEHMIKKLAAIKCYERELRQPPHPRSEELIWAQALMCGSKVGVQYAEPYTLLFRRDRCSEEQSVS